MSQDKTLQGAHILFAHATSTGHTQNQYGNGKMDLSLHRPHSPYPWLDLGVIYYSAPTAEQLKAIEKICEEDPYGAEAHNRSDVCRRLSFKQAEYVNYLIREMLTEKFGKDGIPCDDEIVEIMKQVREGNYPINRDKREQRKKYELTPEQNMLLGQLRQVASEKDIVVELTFFNIDGDNIPSNNGRGVIRFTRPGGNFSFSFTGNSGFCEALKNSIYQLERVSATESTTEQINTSQPVQKPVFPPNRIESEDHRQLGNLIEKTKKRCEENEADRVLAVNKTLTDYKNQTK